MEKEKYITDGADMEAGYSDASDPAEGMKEHYEYPMPESEGEGFVKRNNTHERL